MSVVVLAPMLPFAAIHRAFVAAGWRGGATTQAAPLVPAEPEFAVWRRATTIAYYDANPVVWLRVLRVRGLDPIPELPRLSEDDVLALLQSEDRTSRLRGVLATTELRLTAARPRLAELAASAAEPLIPQYARQALRALGD